MMTDGRLIVSSSIITFKTLTDSLQITKKSSKSVNDHALHSKDSLTLSFFVRAGAMLRYARSPHRFSLRGVPLKLPVSGKALLLLVNHVVIWHTANID